MMIKWRGALSAVVLVGLLSACASPITSDDVTAPSPDTQPSEQDISLNSDGSGDTSLQSDAAPDDAVPSEPDTEPVPDTTASDTTHIDTSVPEPTPPEPQPVRYRKGPALSPMSAFVAARLKAIAAIDPALQSDVFMKVGASTTVSSRNLKCLAGNNVELADYEALEDTRLYFLEGDAAGTSPYERKTLAAQSGMSAGWAIKGTPSPVEAEFEAIAPRYALIHYGTNDMGLGSTKASALWKFADNMLILVDELMSWGVVPVLFAIAARGDYVTSDRWVDTYNETIRGIAQSRQIPFVDVHIAIDDLEGHGLSSDGIHLNTFKQDGSYQACVFTDDGLAYGFNVRNLLSLQLLDAVKGIVVDDSPAPAAEDPFIGTGAPTDPFIIDSLPFSHHADTTESPYSSLDFYSGCEADQNETGPEYIYRFETDVPRRIRAMVIDSGDVDVDLHILTGSVSEQACQKRAHQIIETTLPAGTHYFSLDTFVSQSGPHPGPYLFVVLDCDADDKACD